MCVVCVCLLVDRSVACLFDGFVVPLHARSFTRLLAFVCSLCLCVVLDCWLFGWLFACLIE